MSYINDEYTSILIDIIDNGFTYTDNTRKDTQLRQIPHATLVHRMSRGFPLLSCKKVNHEAVIHELIWMLSGADNISYLKKNGVKIWDGDAANYSKNGIGVGRIYGQQWRKHRAVNNTSSSGITYTEVDQIAVLIGNMKDNEAFLSRRLIVNAWCAGDIDYMALPPCHWAFEIIPTSPDSFNLKWHQRSVDAFLGLPFNIASYAFLGLALEKITGRYFDTLIGDLSNVHIYSQHIDVANEMLDKYELEGYNGTVNVVVDENLHNIDGINIDTFNIGTYRNNGVFSAPLINKKDKTWK